MAGNNSSQRTYKKQKTQIKDIVYPKTGTISPELSSEIFISCPELPLIEGNKASELKVHPLNIIKDSDTKDNFVAMFFIRVPFNKFCYITTLFYTFIKFCKGNFIKKSRYSRFLLSLLTTLNAID